MCIPVTRIALIFTIVALAATWPAACLAQAYRDSEHLTLLRQPGRKLSLAMPMPPYPHPADPVGVALLVSWRFPVSISETPPPELADFARGLDAYMLERATGHFARRIVAVGEMGVTEERLAEAAARGVVIQPATPEQIHIARKTLGAATLLGRIGPVARHVDAVFIPANRVIVRGEDVGGVAFTSRHIALDVSIEAESSSILPGRPGMGARQLLYNLTHELEHLFWHSLTDEQRSAFTSRFWPGGVAPSRNDTVSEYAMTNPLEDFAECFVFACFYPTTFETEPVLGQQVALPGPGKQLQGQALKRVAHIDQLISEALAPPKPLNRLRENRFSSMLDSFKSEDEGKPDEDQPGLFDALDPNRNDD